MMYQRLVKKTDDGSSTLFIPELNEHFHSTFGAIQESKHIFINAGLNSFIGKCSDLKILEVGYGTGLNALMTLNENEKNQFKIEYTGIEAYPITENEHQQLNYSNILQINDNQLFDNLFYSAWHETIKINKYFHISKIKSTFEDFETPNNCYDLVYFDAFAPDVQPELWKEEIFEKIFKSMKKGGILVSYCCKGIVKRALKSNGFQIELLPGPPGKREILRASKL